MDRILLQKLDSHMVLSILNEKLRLECDSLTALVSRYELDSSWLMGSMAQIGYRYDPVSNQFKPRA